MAGTTGLEPAASAVTDFSGNYSIQWTEARLSVRISLMPLLDERFGLFSPIGIRKRKRSAPSRHRAPRVLGGEVDAGDLDDGLPRGFLVGAIVKVRVAHRLNWACELLRLRGEELL